MGGCNGYASRRNADGLTYVNHVSIRYTVVGRQNRPARTVTSRDAAQRISRYHRIGAITRRAGSERLGVRALPTHEKCDEERQCGYQTHADSDSDPSTTMLLDVLPNFL